MVPHKVTKRNNHSTVLQHSHCHAARMQPAHLALAPLEETDLGPLQKANKGGVSIDQAWMTCMHLQTSHDHASHMRHMICHSLAAASWRFFRKLKYPISRLNHHVKDAPQGNAELEQVLEHASSTSPLALLCAPHKAGMRVPAT